MTPCNSRDQVHQNIEFYFCNDPVAANLARSEAHVANALPSSVRDHRLEQRSEEYLGHVVPKVGAVLRGEVWVVYVGHGEADPGAVKDVRSHLHADVLDLHCAQLNLSLHPLLRLRFFILLLCARSRLRSIALFRLAAQELQDLLHVRMGQAGLLPDHVHVREREPLDGDPPEAAAQESEHVQVHCGPVHVDEVLGRVARGVRNHEAPDVDQAGVHADFQRLDGHVDPEDALVKRLDVRLDGLRNERATCKDDGCDGCEHDDKKYAHHFQGAQGQACQRERRRRGRCALGRSARRPEGGEGGQGQEAQATPRPRSGPGAQRMARTQSRHRREGRA
mmetsp:Transcript_21827/g.60566  ORF Transcript_21827/g.60566 Transcript_21827/m.60566 type:complete len:335 (-) Transcript_21827:2-1006(-)